MMSWQGYTTGYAGRAGDDRTPHPQGVPVRVEAMRARAGHPEPDQVLAGEVHSPPDSRSTGSFWSSGTPARAARDSGRTPGPVDSSLRPGRTSYWNASGQWVSVATSCSGELIVDAFGQVDGGLISGHGKTPSGTGYFSQRPVRSGSGFGGVDGDFGVQGTVYGHLSAMSSSRLRCWSSRSPWRVISRWMRSTMPDRVTQVAQSSAWMREWRSTTSTRSSGQPLRSAYIRRVIEVQAPSAASSRSYGEGRCRRRSAVVRRR